jgi:hypothetical protein
MQPRQQSHYAASLAVPPCSLASRLIMQPHQN